MISPNWAGTQNQQNDLCVQRRLRSAQVDLSLRWVHKSVIGFDVLRLIVFKESNLWLKKRTGHVEVWTYSDPLGNILLYLYVHAAERVFNTGIKHDFPFINIRKVPREVLKTDGEALGFQHFPRDLANVSEWQNHVWSLLLHKFNDNTSKIEKMFAHFILQPYHHFLTRARFL